MIVGIANIDLIKVIIFLNLLMTIALNLGAFLFSSLDVEEILTLHKIIETLKHIEYYFQGFQNYLPSTKKHRFFLIQNQMNITASKFQTRKSNNVI